MEERIIIGNELPNIPWENKPDGCCDVMWRSSSNPIVTKHFIKKSSKVYNSAVIPYMDKFAGVFRSDTMVGRPQLHVGFSPDGIHWEINDAPIVFINNDKIAYGYDPRVTKIEDRYYVTWCSHDSHGPTISISYTFDFCKFYQMENAFLPCNRNGVIFPRKINGKYAMLSRPSDNGHTGFGEIFYSESPDMTHWGYHRHVMGTERSWQSTKVGAGPVPIETDEGWLIIYHGVQSTCNGFVYSAGGAILDIDQPWKVLHRTNSFIIGPDESYERIGHVPNVVFPCAALCDGQSGKIAMYYGAADTYVALAYTYAQDLIEYIKLC